MDELTPGFWWLVALPVLLLGWQLGRPAWQRWQVQRQARGPFPKAWRKVLQKRWALYPHLPPVLQQRLQHQIKLWMARIPVLGCQGLKVTTDMQVLIAAQACLPLVGRQPEHPHLPPYPMVRQVLLYPGAFVAHNKQHEAGGVVTEGPQVRLGESWGEAGQVVLSWPDVVAGAKGGEWAAKTHRNMRGTDDTNTHAHNVVIHELVHQLDQARGPANGGPPLPPGVSAKQWQQVMAQAYKDLQWLLQAGVPTAMDAYGATAPEEFFAVASESFFMRPKAFLEQFPTLYDLLQHYFKLNPSNWH